jgi:hypothetical protein
MAQLIEAQQNGYITHNEALKVLDALVNCSVIDKDLTAPPGGETDGDAYIVGAGATGDWATHDDDIAFYFGGYIYITPITGFLTYVADEALTYAFVGAAWGIRTISLAELAEIATDKLLGRATAGTGAVELISCTAAGRALLDDAAASNQRTTLGFVAEILDKASPGAIGGSTPSTGAFTDLSASAKLVRSTAVGITASTTQSQGQQPLTKDINEIAVCANADDVATLPTASAGRRVAIQNNGAEQLQIFPASGDGIDDNGANISVTLAAGAFVEFVTSTAAQWYTAASAGGGAPALHAASHTDGADDIQDATAGQKGVATAAQITKLDAIEALADVTDATNVNTAGATMNADTNVKANGWVIDENDMSSDLDTKVPTQQSVKKYVDDTAAGLTAANFNAYRTTAFDMAADDTWYDYPWNVAATVKTGFTHSHTASAEEVTVTAAGVYLVTWYGSLSAAINGGGATRLLLDGTEVPGSYRNIHIDGGSTRGQQTSTMVVAIGAGEVIKAQFACTNNGADIVYIDPANLPDPTTFVSGSISIVKVA